MMSIPEPVQACLQFRLAEVEDKCHVVLLNLHLRACRSTLCLCHLRTVDRHEKESGTSASGSCTDKYLLFL